jgi:hypothetical protein
MPKQMISREEIKSRNAKIREYVLSNPDKLNSFYDDTAKHFQVSSEVVRHVCRKIRSTSLIKKENEVLPIQVPEFKITEHILIRKENAEIKSLKHKLNKVLQEYEELSNSYDIALNLKTANVDKYPSKLQFTDKQEDHEATAIVQISDGHFGKIVVPSTVNGLNTYNPDIAKKRMIKCAENTIKLIKKERSSINIDKLFLILGGDFLENSQLHHHSEMTTSMSPMEETLFSRELLSKYISTVCEYGDFKEIVIACTRGNHSRITHRMIASVDYRMNYETILYNILKEDYKKENIKWTIPDSEIAEVQMYNKLFRVMHGHQIKYGGGIGGLTIPLNKYIMRMDQINKAYYNFIHHYHSLSYPTSNSTINGSIVGYDPYAMSIGCSYQPPMQSFQLMDSKYGMTIKAPIFCD